MKKAFVLIFSMFVAYILGMRSGARQQFEKIGIWKDSFNLYRYDMISAHGGHYDNCYKFANVVNSELKNNIRRGKKKISFPGMEFDVLYSPVKGPILNEFGRGVCAVMVYPRDLYDPRISTLSAHPAYFIVDSKELQKINIDVILSPEKWENFQRAYSKALRPMGRRTALQAYSYLLQSDDGRRPFFPDQVFK